MYRTFLVIVAILVFSPQVEAAEVRSIPHERASTKSDNPRAQWQASMDAAFAASESGKYSLAKENYEKALQVIEVTNPNSLDAAATIASLASQYIHLKDFKTAEALFNRALRIYKANNASAGEISAVEEMLAACRMVQGR